MSTKVKTKPVAKSGPALNDSDESLAPIESKALQARRIEESSALSEAELAQAAGVLLASARASIRKASWAIAFALTLGALTIEFAHRHEFQPESTRMATAGMMAAGACLGRILDVKLKKYRSTP